MSKTTVPSSPGAERRKFRRRSILEVFSLFIVIPKKGTHRLRVKDVSEEGIGFDLDIEGEPLSDFSVALGDRIDFRLYVNQTLFLPLSIQVARIAENPGMRQIGAVFQNKSSKTYDGYKALLKMLDSIEESE